MYGLTDGLTNQVTTSLLELPIAAINLSLCVPQCRFLFICTIILGGHWTLTSTPERHICHSSVSAQSHTNISMLTTFVSAQSHINGSILTPSVSAQSHTNIWPPLYLHNLTQISLYWPPLSLYNITQKNLYTDHPSLSTQSHTNISILAVRFPMFGSWTQNSEYFQGIMKQGLRQDSEDAKVLGPKSSNEAF